MLNWLHRIDGLLFAPPHTFETILAYVVVRLGLAFEDESDERPKRETPSTQKRPKRDPI